MEKLEAFCMAFLENDMAAIEEGFRENFYHGILKRHCHRTEIC